MSLPVIIGVVAILIIVLFLYFSNSSDETGGVTICGNGSGRCGTGNNGTGLARPALTGSGMYQNFPSDVNGRSLAPLKILALHGGGSTAASMNLATRQLQERLPNSIWFFIDASEITYDNEPSGRMWFRDPPGGKNVPTTSINWADPMVNMVRGKEFLLAFAGGAQNLPSGVVAGSGNPVIDYPLNFDGLVGFSQGAAAVNYMLSTSIYSGNQIRFAVSLSGYLPTTHEGLMENIDNHGLNMVPWCDQRNSAVSIEFANSLPDPSYFDTSCLPSDYRNKSTVPILMYSGRNDNIIPISQTREACDAFDNVTWVEDDGGHAIPTSGQAFECIASWMDTFR